MTTYAENYPDRLQVRLPPHWADLLREYAAWHNTTVAEMVRFALDFHYVLASSALYRSKKIRDQAMLPFMSDEERRTGGTEE